MNFFINLFDVNYVFHFLSSLNREKFTMRDSRGVNRMVQVLNSGIETESSSNPVSKSTPVDATVLKERNTNESNETAKSIANHAKDSKADDNCELKSNAQSASELKLKRSLSHQSGNDLMINLDLDDIDYDEKCAKGLTSEGDNDSLNALSMDVDEPSENLYVTNSNKTRNEYDRSGPMAKLEDDIDDPVTIESEEESSKSNAPHESKIIVNGIGKGNSSSSSTNDTDKDNRKSPDDNNTVKTTNKSNKRKISISSDEEQGPPAKK